MIEFFRRLRGRMLETNRYTKYIFYAIGEIILVVIGILIALQINNWNEEKKLHEKEIKKLTEIAQSLNQTKENIKLAQIEDTRWMGYNEIILDHLQNKKPYSPNLDICFGSYFWFSRPEIEFSAFEQLKSSGLDLISSDSLRTEIVKLFETRFQLLYSENNQWNVQYLNTTLPIHIKRFHKIFPDSYSPGNDEYAKPVNYNALFDDDEFKNLLAENIGLRNFGISYYDLAIEECETLVTSIETELKKLKDD